MVKIYINRFRNYLLALLLMLSCSTGFAQVTVVYPPGNPASTYAFGHGHPLGAFFGYERTQFIYTLAELGIPTGTILTNLAFYLGSISTPPQYDYNYKIYIKEVPYTTVTTGVSWATLISTATLVYSSPDLTPGQFNPGTWINSALANNIVNSGLNLEFLVETNWALTGDGNGWFNNAGLPAPVTATGPLGTDNAIVFYQNTKTNCAQHWQADNTPPTLGGARNFRPNVQITYVNAPPCPGPPGGIIASTSANPVCCNAPFSLSLTGLPLQSGFTFQWFSSSTSGVGPWTLVTGATTPFYQTTLATCDTIWYYCRITCGTSSNSSVIQINQAAITDCYCPSSAISSADTDIGNVTFGGINNGTAAPITQNPSASALYTNYTQSVGAGSIQQGQTYPISITQITGGFTFFAAYCNVFIDYNRDGVFDPVSERVFSGPTASAASPTTSGFVFVPYSASTGKTRMRVILNELGSFPNGSITNPPCGTYTWGETEDYNVDITPAPNCGSPVVPGTTTSSAPAICPLQPFTLSVSGNSTAGFGQTWQWDSSSVGCAGPWFPCTGPGNNLSYYTTNTNTSTWYHCQMTCGASTDSSSCYLQNVNLPQQCYCNSNLHGTVNCGTMYINSVNINSLANNNTGCTSGNGVSYTVYPGSGTTTTSITQNSTYNLSVTSGGSQQSISVWIDWNGNGIYETTEWYGLTGNPVQTQPVGTYTLPVTVPPTSVTGVTGMRVRSRVNTINGAGDPCTTFGSGETEDYLITILAYVPPVCTSAPAITTALANGVTTYQDCSGSVINLTLTPASATNFSALTYVWEIDTFFGGATTWQPLGAPNLKTFTTTQSRYARYRCSISCPSASATIVPSNPTTFQNKPAHWLGMTSNWSDGQNWCGRVPTAADSVWISLAESGRPAASYRAPVIGASTVAGAYGATNASMYNLLVDATDSVIVRADSLNSFAVSQHVVNNGLIHISSTTSDTTALSNGAIGATQWTPFRGSIYEQLAQFIFSAQELALPINANNSRMQANDVIDSLFFHIRQQNSTRKYQDFNISYGFTTDAQFSSSTPYTGLTQIFHSDSLDVAGLTPGATCVPPGVGICSGTLKLPVTNFRWDGTSNIILQICYNSGTSKALQNDFLYATTTTGFKTYLQLGTDNVGDNGCGLLPSTTGVQTNFTPTPNRPNITFSFHRKQMPITASIGTAAGLRGGGLKNNGSGSKFYASTANLTINGTVNNDGIIGFDSSSVTVVPSSGNTGDWLNNGTTDLGYNPTGVLRKSQVYFNGTNWNNSGTMTPGTKSRVVFGGALNQTIGGLNPSTFNSFRMEKGATTQSITLNQPMVVNDSLVVNLGKIVMNQKSITINNPSAGGMAKVSSAATFSGLVSEDSLSKVNWSIGTNNVSHFIPFVDASVTHNLPVEIANTSGPVNNIGTVTVATYATNSVNQPYPPGPNTDPSPLNNLAGANNSALTADRYWIVGKSAGSGSGATTLGFVFSDPERTSTNTQPASTAGATGMTAANPGRAQPWGQAGGWRSAASVGTQVYTPSNPPLSLPMPAYNVARINTVRITNYLWTYGNSNPWAVSTSLAPLPIKLVSFTAKADNDHTRINWATASEDNNDYFTVQRTTDFNSIIEIAKVPSHNGNSSEMQYYETFDQNPVKGINYYRLLQTDRGGTAVPASDYIAVRFGVKSTFEILSISNETQVEVIFDYDSELPVDYFVTDMLGKTVASGANNPATTGVNILKLDATTWHHGMYLITLQNKDKSVTRKMVY